MSFLDSGPTSEERPSAGKKELRILVRYVNDIIIPDGGVVSRIKELAGLLLGPVILIAIPQLGPARSWYAGVWFAVVAGAINPFRYYRGQQLLLEKGLRAGEILVSKGSNAGVYAVLESLQHRRIAGD
jgi:hypothetical protein